MERIVPGLYWSSGMEPPDDLLLCLLPRNEEKERPGGNKPMAPGRSPHWLFCPISKMVKAKEDKNSLVG